MDTNLYEKRERVQNQQINTFTKGMDTDTSDMYLGSELYRYAENVRPVTNKDSNDGELHLINGVYSPNYKSFFSRIIATTAIRNYCIIIGIRQRDHGWSIYKFDKDSELTDECRIFGPCNEFLLEPLSLVTRYESDNNIKLYIASKNRNILSININHNDYHNPPCYFTYYTAISNDNVVKIETSNWKQPQLFIEDEQQDYVVDTVYLYKHSETPITELGFTSSLEYNVQLHRLVLFPSGWVRDDYESEYPLYVTVATIRTKNNTYNISFEEWSTPILFIPGETNVNLVYLYCRSNNVPTLPQQDIYYNFTENKIYNDYLCTSEIEERNIPDLWSIDIPEEMNVPYNDTLYIGANGLIFLHLPNLTVENGGGIFKGPILQYTYRVYSTGGLASQTSPLSKLISISKTLDAGYGFGYSKRDVFAKTVNISIDTSNVGNYLNKLLVIRIQYVENGQEPIIDIIYDSYILQNILDTGTSLKTISVSEFVSMTGIQLKPALIESKGDYLFAGNIYYEQDEIDKLFEGSTLTYEIKKQSYSITNKNEIISGEGGRSLKRGEYYRYGIIFYTKDGKRTSVMCITDAIYIPEDDYIVNMLNTGTNSALYEIERVGLTFTVSIPENAKNECVGYEIVRCKRTYEETVNIASGIIGNTFYDNYNRKPLERYANPFLSLLVILCDHNVESYPNSPVSANSDIYTIAIPEYVFDEENFKSIVDDNYGNLEIKFLKHYNSKIVGGTIIENTSYYSAGRGAYFYKKGNTWTLYSARPNMGDDDTYALKYNTGIQKQIVLTSYMYPVSAIETNEDRSMDIIEYEYVLSPKYDSFSEGENIKAFDNITSIGEYNFTNWFFSWLLYKDDGAENTLAEYTGEDWAKYYTSTGGKVLLVKAQGSLPSFINNSNTSLLPISIVNIHRKNTKVPYGGDGDYAKQNCVFYSFGNYKTFHSDSENTIDVFDGDCYIYCFEFVSSHCWISDKFHSKMCPVIYSVPIESYIDLYNESGAKFISNPSEYKSFIQDDEVNIDYGEILYVLERKKYNYNTAYNINPSAISYVPITYTKISSNVYDTRIYYSDKKLNGETIDSWYQFKPANFLDVDSRYGEITNLRLFKDTLLFWQESATGILSVNERTVLLDVNNTNIILGNGDILLRYDYISTVYGMKKDNICDVLSDDYIYWIDTNAKELLLYLKGQSLNTLKKQKNILNYINSGEISDNVTIAYDFLNREVLFNIINNNPIVYSEITLKFISVYKIPFQRSISFKDKMFFINEDNIYIDSKNNKTAISTTEEPLFPKIDFVVNLEFTYNKVFDIQTIGGRFYLGGFDDDRSIPYTGSETLSIGDKHARNNDSLKYLSFTYKTPLKQESRSNGKDVITNTEYDFRLNIPRAGYETVITENEELQNESRTYKWNVNEYGDRMKGKTMQCELKSSSNDLDFSLQYVITKFRISWT